LKADPRQLVNISFVGTREVEVRISQFFSKYLVVRNILYLTLSNRYLYFDNNRLIPYSYLSKALHVSVPASSTGTFSFGSAGVPSALRM